MASFTMLDMYKSYISKNNDINKHLYYKIINEFNEKISREIVENSYEFKLPFALGSIFIDKKIKKNKTSVIDWKATKELWEEDQEYKQNKKLVYELNPHSDGFVMKWKWNKGKFKTTHTKIFSFVPTRYNKRYLAKQIKENQINYYDCKVHKYRPINI